MVSFEITSVCSCECVCHVCVCVYVCVCVCVCVCQLHWFPGVTLVRQKHERPKQATHSPISVLQLFLFFRLPLIFP
jgi:hypothetical protein